MLLKETEYNLASLDQILTARKNFEAKGSTQATDKLKEV
jgi:hypothetical protein